MEFSNEGESFYHRFQGSFLSDDQGKLLHCTGSRQQWLHDNWNSVNSNARLPQNANVKVYHSSRASQHNKPAVLVDSQLTHPRQAGFEAFFVQLILDQADLCCTNTRPAEGTDVEAVTHSIVDLFDSYLRYQGKDDRWVAQGRAYFTERVRHFTAQNARIEFCLPAFPCKSSNLDKVTGSDPDQGEELALQRLHGFVEAIEQVYEPGAKLWVISDGHVFSDCIGVDDADVDAYGEKLKVMNRTIGLRRGNADRVGFKSLVDLFQLATIQLNEGLESLASRLNIPAIDHHVTTKVTEEAELCRQVLMAGCAPRKSAVRARIDSKDAGITALYRGFSRFMLEDLEHHPHTRGMTRSQQKKLSSKVAFEMILRNQAYSNLVEMLFPNHVRLSIHAHNNAGPKFGIQLFDPTKVRAVEALSSDGELMTSLDLLHIPTPWHNSVVRLEGSDLVLVAKAKLARAALAAGSMEGGMVGGEEGRARFSLRRRAAIPTPPVTPPPSAVVVVVDSRAMAEVKTEKDATAVVAVEVPAETERFIHEKVVSPAPAKPRRRATLSEKADVVVTAVVRRNTGSFSATAPSQVPKHDSWMGRLRWILSLFWPREV